MTVYVSLLGAILVLILAIILWFLIGPIGLLLLILVAILLWLAFRSSGSVAAL
jgi:hypothetical protein